MHMREIPNNFRLRLRIIVYLVYPAPRSQHFGGLRSYGILVRRQQIVKSAAQHLDRVFTGTATPCGSGGQSTIKLPSTRLFTGQSAQRPLGVTTSNEQFQLKMGLTLR